ncbi:MAG: arginine kinase [Desulfobacteraceae bacterium]|nr:arginine kinase [Desulfobacteraceae bacterium]
MDYPIFSDESKSLIKKHLTFDRFHALKNKKTDNGFTFAKAIRSGIANPDSDVGIYAGDAQTYETFSRVLKPIILDYHSVSNNVCHTSDFSKSTLPLMDPENIYILSTRIRVARNLNGFPFTPNISLVQRKKVEQKITRALASLDKDFKGIYAPLNNLPPKDGRIQKGFPKGDRFQDAAGINADFPKCRGIFHSHNKKFQIWAQEEDHLRIISMDQGSDMASIFNRLAKGLDQLENNLEFACHKQYGFLTSCPSNIGTSMRASVHIKLKKLNRHPELLNEIITSHNLQARGTQGEKTQISQSVFDISNHRRLGLTETQCIQDLFCGCRALIQAEKEV